MEPHTLTPLGGVAPLGAPMVALAFTLDAPSGLDKHEGRLALRVVALRRETCVGNAGLCTRHQLQGIAISQVGCQPGAR